MGTAISLPVTRPGDVLQHKVLSYTPVVGQQLTGTYVDIDGSNIDFTPISSNSKILYKFHFQQSASTSQEISHFYLDLDGVEQVGSKVCERNGTNNGSTSSYANGTIDYSFVIDSWGTSQRTIKLRGREYDSSGSYQAVIHATSLSDGAIGIDLVNATLEVIEISN